MPDDMQDIPIKESELPRRDVPTRSAMQELIAAGYRQASGNECRLCGKKVWMLESPVNAGMVVCNPDGTLHVNCRDRGDPMPEPLPPVPTFEQQQEKLDQLMRERGLK